MMVLYVLSVIWENFSVLNMLDRENIQNQISIDPLMMTPYLSPCFS